MKRFATITVIGKDKTGVVARVTGFLFEQGANIEGLEEQVTRGQFSMTIQASWKTKVWHSDRLRDGLQKLAASLGMSLKDIVSEGQKLESKILVKAVKLYLSKRLDVYWGIVREI